MKIEEPVAAPMEAIPEMAAKLENGDGGEEDKGAVLDA